MLFNALVIGPIWTRSVPCCPVIIQKTCILILQHQIMQDSLQMTRAHETLLIPKIPLTLRGLAVYQTEPRAFIRNYRHHFLEGHPSFHVFHYEEISHHYKRYVFLNLFLISQYSVLSPSWSLALVFWKFFNGATCPVREVHDNYGHECEWISLSRTDAMVNEWAQTFPNVRFSRDLGAKAWALT